MRDLEIFISEAGDSYHSRSDCGALVNARGVCKKKVGLACSAVVDASLPAAASWRAKHDFFEIASLESSCSCSCVLCPRRLVVRSCVLYSVFTFGGFCSGGLSEATAYDYSLSWPG